MNHKEFFDILIGKAPPEVELEIEIKCREVKDLPDFVIKDYCCCLLYTSPSPRDATLSRMPSSA